MTTRDTNVAFLPSVRSNSGAGKAVQASTTRAVAAVAMLAVSPATLALAQSSSGSSELPAIVVEGQKAKPKKKPVAAKKSSAPKQVKQAEPVPQAPVDEPVQAAGPVPSSGSIGPGTGQPADSFKVDNLQSGKATSPLLYTPQTVTVVPAQILKERGATNLTQALRNTPGITFDAGENGFSTSTNNFKVRGIDTSGSIFVDGVRDNGSYARDTFNVDRVEVIKGAASDNGRGGAAGYVNLVTKTPDVENFVRGEATLSLDEHGGVRERGTVDVNQRVGTAAVRLNGMIEEGDMFGRDVADVEAFGIAPSLALGLGTDTRLIFSYEHLERRDTPDWGMPGAMLKGMWLYDPQTRGASRTNYYGLKSDFDDVTSQSAMARIEHDINDSWTISNQTRYSVLDREARFTVPEEYLPGNPPATNVLTVSQYYDRENDSLSNQTNVTGRFFTGLFKHTLSTGVELSRETSDANRFGTQDSFTNLFNPNPNRPVSGVAVTQKNDVTVETAAVYLYDTVDLTRQWALTGGIRVEHYNVEIGSNTVLGAPQGPFDGYEDSETTVGGKIGLVYKPTHNGSIYGAYGVSTLPPGSFLSNPDISRTGDNQFPGFVPGADPVEAHNFEIGTKWDWLGGRLSTTAAAFHTTKKKVPYGTPGLNFSDLTYGEQIVRGVELGVAGSLTEKWKVFGGMTFLDSERDHGADVDTIQRNTNGNNYAANPGAGFAGAFSTDGDQLSFTPNFFANLWTTYDVSDKLTVGGGFLYIGESYLGRPDDALRIIPNGRYGELNSYFVVNAMVSYDLTDNVELRFNVDNVFNETYAVSSNWDGSRVQLGDPRVYRLSTSVDF
jgi:catecholate siderophore receptor